MVFEDSEVTLKAKDDAEAKEWYEVLQVFVVPGNYKDGSESGSDSDSEEEED
jgi:hypothetical protein